MGKKSSLPLVYLIGMALIAIGFFCPMFKGLFGSSANGFDFIKNAKEGGFVAIGSILIIAFAVLLTHGFPLLPELQLKINFSYLQAFL